MEEEEVVEEDDDGTEEEEEEEATTTKATTTNTTTTTPRRPPPHHNNHKQKHHHHHYHRFVAVLEGLRQRKVSQAVFMETCALPSLLAMGRELVQAHALHGHMLLLRKSGSALIISGDRRSTTTTTTEEDVVRLLISAFGFALFETDETQQKINGRAVALVRTLAIRLVDHLQTLRASATTTTNHHHNNRATEAAARSALAEHLSAFDVARQHWLDGDAPHAVARLEDALHVKRAETVASDAVGCAALEAMQQRMRRMMEALQDQKGTARALYEVQTARGQRRVVRLKRELTRVKRILYGAWAVWGEEMCAEASAYEERVEELRRCLRHLTSRHVVESEDEPGRYRMHTPPPLSPEATAFADQFFRQREEVEEEDL
jgi:hypothetical protein